MVGWIGQFGPVMQALIATLFTWGVTALGAGLVFFFKSINKKVLNGMLGFAAGVMVAASFWSLLAPGIELAEELGQVAYITAAIGFLAGGAFLYLVDKLLPHLHLGLATDKAEGIKTTWQRSVLLVLAIWAFVWAVRRGQFDDLDTPALDILDDDPKPQRQPPPDAG